MQSHFNQIAILVLSISLPGCAVDSNVSYMPEFLKQRAPKSNEIEQPPDVGSIIRGNVAAVFTPTAFPTNIKFSFPIPAKDGGWTTCIRASVNGATGRSMGEQTFLVNIDHGEVGRREHVDDNHWCAREVYQPI
jgi:hypothetical protein